jgi:hypothetical protein
MGADPAPETLCSILECQTSKEYRNVVVSSVCVFLSLRETKFHIHTQEQVELQFCIVTFLDRRREDKRF